MPHVTITMYPGYGEKQELAQSVKTAVVKQLGVREAAVSVSIEEVSKQDWKQKVYDAVIINNRDTLYIQPGYTMTEKIQK